jgi:hypothetical protein
MSAIIASQDFLATANVFGWMLTTHLLPSTSDISLQINIPNFECSLSFPIIELSSELEAGEVIFRAAIDRESTLVITFMGELEEKEKFQIKQIGLNIETATKLAHSDFTLASIRAMLSLAELVNLQVSELQLNLGLKFEEPLLTISQMLRRRQIAYRIMVIERATGYRFQLPPDISGEEVKNIALIYHAITEGSFVWPIGEVGYGFPATKEVLNRLLSLNQLSSVKFGPHPITVAIFDKIISLGEGYITVEDKVIENFDEVIKELALDDRHIVHVVVRSLSGQGRYDLPEAPRLPDNPWDEKIQGLIALEEQLDETLVARYHALAASTLEGLTEEERIAITARPELDEQAFLPGN